MNTCIRGTFECSWEKIEERILQDMKGEAGKFVSDYTLAREGLSLHLHHPLRGTPLLRYSERDTIPIKNILATSYYKKWGFYLE